MLSLQKTINYHSKGLSHILILKDGRLSSSSSDGSLIIYNENFEPDLIINEHKDIVNYHIQLRNENIVTCSWDYTLKIIKLIGKDKYEVVQILKAHEFVVDKAIELEDGRLLTCADDNYIIIWKKNTNNDLYELEKKVVNSLIEFPNANIVLINKNLLLGTSLNEFKLRFYEIDNNFQLIYSFDSIHCCFSRNSILYIEERDLLLVGGSGKYIGGIYLFKLKKIPYLIGNVHTNWIRNAHSIILLEDGNVLIGLEEYKRKKDLIIDEQFSICKFKIIENDKKLKLVNKLGKAHISLINGLIEWKEKDLIVSCSHDKQIKLWKMNDK